MRRVQRICGVQHISFTSVFRFSRTIFFIKVPEHEQVHLNKNAFVTIFVIFPLKVLSFNKLKKYFSIVQLLSMLSKISKQLEKYPQTGQSRSDKVHVQGLHNIKGEIIRSPVMIDEGDFDTLIELVKNQVRSFYPGDIANRLIKEQLSGLIERKLARDRVYMISKDNSGSMQYFVLLKKQVKVGGKNQLIVATYKYKVSYSIPNDMYIKNYTYSSYKQTWYGSSSSTYICVDNTEWHARGLTQEDIKILCYYADMFELEYDKLTPADIA